VQIVRVEAITQVGGERQRGEISGHPQALGNRRPAVDFFPGALVPLGKLLYGHGARLEDDVLSVVELPVFRQDSSFALEPGVQGRSGKRRQHRETRQIDAGIEREFDRGVEDVGRVVVEAKHEAALNGNSEVVQIADDLFETNRSVEALLGVAQALRRDGFQTQQQALASTARDEFHKLGIMRQQNRGQAEPFDLERHQLGEKFAGVFAVGDQIEVDENELLLTELPDVVDHPSDGFLILLSSPCRRSDAKLAVMHARAGGLEDGLGQELARVEQLPAGIRHVGPVEREIRRLVVGRLQRAARKIAQQRRPTVFGVTDADGVRVQGGFLREQGDMRAAKNDRFALGAKARGEFIGAPGRSGNDGEPDEVGIGTTPSSYTATCAFNSAGTSAASVVKVNG
jgi:hypothetical protein